MRSLRRAPLGSLFVIGAVVASTGCECGSGARPAMRAEPASEEMTPIDPAPAEVEVPRVARTDLPTATPRVTVIAEPRGYRVTNAELVASWPAADRARVAAAAPPIAPTFPVVEIAVPVVDPVPLAVPALRDALSLAAEADRAVSTGHGATTHFALRAPAELPWGRVIRALYAAAVVGYADPDLIVRDAAGAERLLSLSGDDGGREGDATTAARVREALETLGHPIAPIDGAPAPAGGEPGTEAASPIGGVPSPGGPAIAGAESVGVALFLELDAHGLSVHRGPVVLAPDCRLPRTSEGPTVPQGSLDPESLEACFSAVGAIRRATIAADPALTYGDVIELLDVLTAHARQVAVQITPSASAR